MLRKTILALGLALSILLPASAELAIDNFKAYKEPDSLRFVITMHNISDVAQQGPVMIRLMSRPSASAKWVEVQSWDVERVRAGSGWSEEVENADELASAKKNSGYEAKLVVEAPGMQTAEKTAMMIGK